MTQTSAHFGAEGEPRAERVKRMPLWRWLLYRWMERHQYPDYRAYGIPAEQVVLVEVPLETDLS